MRFSWIIVLSLAANLVQADERRTITVSARSELQVKPDAAIIQCEVFTENKELVIAKTENDAITSAVFKQIKAQKIGHDSLKVTDFKMGPRYADDRTLYSYTVSRSFEIRVGDFAVIEPLIGGLAKAGGEQIIIEELRFQVRDQRKHQVEARRLAVEYARTKAAHLAELGQAQLSDVIAISEEVEKNFDSGGWGLGGDLSAQELARERFVNAQIEARGDKPEGDAKVENDVDPLLAPGVVSLNATVQITFELLPKK